jgi:hypothetical protein
MTELSSYAGLTRVSIALREKHFRKGWIAGSSPAMTELSSYAGLTRVSIALREKHFRRGWIAGSSAAMTVERKSRRGLNPLFSVLLNLPATNPA